MSANQFRCKAINISGPRKGLQCNIPPHYFPSKNNYGYCGKHLKLFKQEKNNYEPMDICEEESDFSESIAEESDFSQSISEESSDDNDDFSQDYIKEEKPKLSEIRITKFSIKEKTVIDLTQEDKINSKLDQMSKEI